MTILLINDRFMELPCFLDMNLGARNYMMDNFLQKMQELQYESGVPTNNAIHIYCYQTIKCTVQIMSLSWS